MLKEKKSFFERLAGSISVDDEDEPIMPFEQADEEEEELPIKHVPAKAKSSAMSIPKTATHITYDDEEEADMEMGDIPPPAEAPEMPPSGGVGRAKR